YTTDSDLAADNYLTAADEYIVLLETVATDGTTPDGRESQASNIVYAPASNNADQTPHKDAETGTEKPVMTNGAGLVAYDLMMGADRTHNDGGIIIPPTYAIEGFVFEDADYSGTYDYLLQHDVEDKNGNKIDYIEHGYVGKKVILKLWYYDPANGGWQAVIDPATGKQKLLNELTGTTSVDNGEGGQAEVTGYYKFDNLSTTYRVKQTSGKWKYYLAGYTVEVNGESDDDGMTSLLATTYQWKTTDMDAWNSKAEPMVTTADAGNAQFADYSLNNYPVRWTETTIQTGSEPHKSSETANGVAKNVLQGKIVLAGIGDEHSKDTQSLTFGTGDDAMIFDFALGQGQTAMNAGFAPPDHSNLVGAVWFDENYDGIRDNLTPGVDDNAGTAGEGAEAGIDGISVVLTQYYFVPKYDEYNHQLYEDEDGNIFWKDENGELRLHKRSETVSNIVVDANDDVYLVRNGRLFKYNPEKLDRTMTESGTWVENRNFPGTYDQVKKLEFDDTSFDLQPWMYVTKTDEHGAYEFTDLPAYVLVDYDLVDSKLSGVNAANPGKEQLDKDGNVVKDAEGNILYDIYRYDQVYQPQSVDTGLAASQVAELQRRPVTVAMIENLTKTELKNLSREQLDAILKKVETEVEQPVMVQKVDENGPVWEKNEDGSDKLDENGERIPVMVEQTELKPVIDPETGEVKQQQKTDENGYPVFEEVQATDPETGDPLWETDENDEPVLDDEGNKIPVMESKPVMEDVMEEVVVTKPVTIKTKSDLELAFDQLVSKHLLIFNEVDYSFDTAKAKPKFTTAKPYLAGYSIVVLSDKKDPETGKSYVASRFHVDGGSNPDKDSDLRTFNASLSGKYNEDNKETTYAVVAQKANAAKANDSYTITYKGIPYDLANRLFLKHAGDAGLVLQDPVYIAGRIWEDVNADGLQDAEEEGIKGAVVKLT
ncbi:MAG: hypothetical protein UCH28_04480, partial [Adlercreutzia sp.]|nr:hypothetical protein [Adlercreutzia sp.]